MLHIRLQANLVALATEISNLNDITSLPYAPPQMGVGSLCVKKKGVTSIGRDPSKICRLSKDCH